MKIYLKFISVCLWLSFIGGLIFYIITMVNTLSRYGGGYYGSTPIIVWILGLIAIIIFGPATAILFGAVGNLVG